MKILFISTLLFLSKLSFGQNPGFKLFLIGDTGEDTVLQTTMVNFLDTISKYPNSATIFLGDNCYKKWIGHSEKKGFDSAAITIKRLGAQMKGLNDCQYKGSVYFIPGNHDWWNVTSMKKGKRHLKMEESFIESNLRNNSFIKNNQSTFLPKDGEPVAAVDLDEDRLKLIFIDSQWMIIQKHEQELSKAYAQLDSILNNAISRNEKIVVTAHHPIYTISKHSKKRKNGFPKFYKDQDIYYPSYQDLRNKLENMFAQKNYPIIYASGHDHVLEYFHKGSVQYIVSGSGSKSNPFDKKHDFNPMPGNDIPINGIAKLSEGFFEIQYHDDSADVIMHPADNQYKGQILNK